jgi:hypothetical protein
MIGLACDPRSMGHAYSTRHSEEHSNRAPLAVTVAVVYTGGVSVPSSTIGQRGRVEATRTGVPRLKLVLLLCYTGALM